MQVKPEPLKVNRGIEVAWLGVSNDPIQFESARKIWPLLELQN